LAKSIASLIPSVEQRETGWFQLQERLAHPHRALVQPSVTISREYGCEGYPLALRLEALLREATGQPWTIFDKALVDKVATDENLSRQMLNHLGDESHAQDVLRTHFGYLTHDDAYARLVKHLVQIASAGCAIIVGRGGAVVCQDLKQCFHVRLVGGLGFRAANLARRLELPLAEAEEVVRTQSRLREQFISDCLHEDITSSRWYDATFNNERLSVETIAQACLPMVLSRWPGKPNLKAGSQPASVGNP
jgi:hypothetical protein